MHPHRYMAGGKPKDTSQPRSRRKFEKRIAGLERHIEANPSDSEARKRLANAKAKLRAL